MQSYRGNMIPKQRHLLLQISFMIALCLCTLVPPHPPHHIFNSTFSAFSVYAYFFSRYNFLYGHDFIIYDNDFVLADHIRSIHCCYGLTTQFESNIFHVHEPLFPCIYCLVPFATPAIMWCVSNVNININNFGGCKIMTLA